MRVVIYSRVSTRTQDYTRQSHELLEYAEKMKYEVVKVFEEQISGAKKNSERPILMDMIEFVKNNNIEKVLTWELSRIGRNSLEVLNTVNLLNSNNISLYIKNFNIETLDADGNVNPMSQFMIQILTSVAEMERSTTRQRIKSGYDNYRRNGGIVGRKKGFRKDNEKLLIEYKDVVKLIKQGYSVRKVMKLTDRSSGTVQKVKKVLEPNL